MTIDQLKPGVIVQGPIFHEPVQVLVATPMGELVKLSGKGLNTGQVHETILSPEQLAILKATPEKEPFDGDALRFRLGVEAMRLGLAFEYDPYFSLSIARVDPLPHQLEAVYDYFLKIPRIRFLLADDPGAGKTIMAGLLIKELKIRGLIKRTIIVTPANLSFQWQREMKDKFRENFEVIRGDVLRTNYGTNPWQEKNQVITSISWVSRIEDANESLMRSHWDLVIVDEAHKMSAYSSDKKTLAYRLGENLSTMTDHYLLMTATPHKGDPKNFCLFLELLDKDIYGDIESLEEAMRRQEAPFYLRRVKEALVTFPDPETGQVKTLFTKRCVETVEFQIDMDEYDFYDALTRYVEDQSIKAAADDSARGRALGFTMALLQRRFASSVYAVRRSLERMKQSREKILADPEGYRQSQIHKKLPEDYEDLTEEEREIILAQLEEVVASIDPAALKEEIMILGKLINQALQLEKREIESKLVKLKQVLTDQGIFQDPKMKLLLFTEHKDTLDYLVNKLESGGLSVTQIHGGMKVGDRDTPGTRIYSERHFREECQIMVATEAAGEGINLQFCWFMINYDIPWNPVRLEQRMGRIHRYGQEKDCLIFNFVAINTREGRVLQKLFERIKKIEDDLDPERTGKIPRILWPRGEELEPRFGRLGREYKQIVFDKEHLKKDPTLEWVTPGHPLFETVRAYALEQVQDDLRRGAVFYDLHIAQPHRLDVFSAAIRDGRGNILHRRLFVVQTDLSGNISVRQPTIFLDLSPAPRGTAVPDDSGLPEQTQLEQTLIQQALQPFLAENNDRREKEIATISRHLEISLNELIHRQNLRMAELLESQQRDGQNSLLAANIKTVEDRLDELNGRLERRREELLKEKYCTIAGIQHYGRAWVLPHPERTAPDIAPVVRDDEIEKIAVQTAMDYERARSWQPESVEKENRGFDLISRKPHPEDPQTAVEVRFIEVKGRAAVGEVALTANEYKTAERLKKDYWLYVVFNCATDPEIHTIQDPTRLGWMPLVKIEHYYLNAERILEKANGNP
ncbi:MAG: DUF3883 domain-containing protein [Dethiobacter sp.]|nr:MAG: DUF3883 domain-containing protein [Dethiobacter sp.]